MEKEITVIDLKELIESDTRLQLIDVRSAENFKKFSIKGSINVPLKDLSSYIPKINNRLKTVLICEDGLASEQGYTLLKACGFYLSIVRGGIRDWRRIFSA